MAHRKSPLLATAVSLIALTSLGGCAQTGSLFNQSGSARMAEAGSPNYQAAMRVADDARSKGDLDTAVSFYGRATQFEPQMSQPLIKLGDVYWQMKNPANSARAFEAARKLEPENESVLRGLGRAYVALNEPKKAQEAYLAALAIDPNNARTLNGLGVAYDLDGDHETAQSHYKAGLALSPEHHDLMNNLAYSHIAAKQYTEAVAILAPLLDKPDTTERQRQNLALAYGLLGKEDDAKRVARIDLSPAEVERNLKIYRQLRNEPSHSRAMADIGKPSFTPPQPERPIAAPATPVSTEVVPPAEAEIVGVPDGAVLIKPPAPPEPEPEAEMAAAPAPVTPPPAPVPQAAESMIGQNAPAATRSEPTDLVSAPAVAAPALPAPSQTGLGSGKIYLGQYADETTAREAWIRVWTANSTTLSSLVASIEPNDGQMALFAVGSSSVADAQSICTKLRQNGVSCGVSK